jgi:hypothetical protein
MVLMGHRGTEKGHYAVSGELIDGPLILMNLVHQDLEATVHDPVNFFWVELFTHSCVISHIGKKHSHKLAFSLDGTARGQDFIGKVFGSIGLGFRLVK